MQNKLLFQSNNDVPFKKAQLIIHQPTINEISLIGENSFFTGCEYLTFSKDNLKQQDKLHLQQFSDFEVLMSIIKDQNIAIKKIKICMELVLSLMFPKYSIAFLPNSILFSHKEGQQIERHFIDKENFVDFRNIVSQMFCLTNFQQKKKKYNPGGPQAQALVKKFQERQAKLNKLKGRNKDQGINILERYVSILSVGLQKDKNQLMQYTVSQLFDEFRRFRKKEDFDIYIQAKMAGAKDLDDIDNWMGEINPEF